MGVQKVPKKSNSLFRRVKFLCSSTERLLVVHKMRKSWKPLIVTQEISVEQPCVQHAGLGFSIVIGKRLISNQSIPYPGVLNTGKGTAKGIIHLAVLETVA